MRERTRALAGAAVGAALSFGVLYLASVLPAARLACICAASLGVVFVRLRSGWKWALGCYGVTAALALLLLPGKGTAAAYGLLTGYYPVFKLFVERWRSRPLRWLAKLVLFNAVFALLYFGLARLLWSDAELASLSPWLVFAAADAAFLVYDFALTEIILIYLRKIAGRIR